LIGANSGQYITTGNGNTGVGISTLGFNNGAVVTTGADNSAIGRASLSTITTGSYNTALGSLSLYANTTADNNTALGYQALTANTTASNNTAVGYQAAYTNTTGTTNTAVGTTALRQNSTTSGHTAVGYRAGYSITTGTGNTAIGVETLYIGDASTSAAVGYQALRASSGSANTALGYQSLLLNSTASNNTAVGYQAGYSNQTGAGFTSLGYQSGYTGTIQSYNTFIGYRSGYLSNVTAGGNGYNTAIGTTAGYGLTTGYNNTFIGSSGSGQGAGYGVTSGNSNVIVGSYTGSAAPISATGSNFVVLSDGDGNIVASAKTAQTFALQGAVPNSGTGISFPATQSASSDANTLDDYEEGTWTPVLYSGATDATMSTDNSGRYTRIGRAVHIQAFVATTTLNGIGGGTLNIKGLPFAVPVIYAAYGGVTGSWGGNLNITANQSIGFVPEAGTSTFTVKIWNAATGSSNMTGTQWSDDGFVAFSLTYFV
jgi:hypothetical protein